MLHLTIYLVDSLYRQAVQNFLESQDCLNVSITHSHSLEETLLSCDQVLLTDDPDVYEVCQNSHKWLLTDKETHEHEINKYQRFDTIIEMVTNLSHEKTGQWGQHQVVGVSSVLPGSGKTSVMMLLADHLSTKQRVAVLKLNQPFVKEGLDLADLIFDTHHGSKDDQQKSYTDHDDKVALIRGFKLKEDYLTLNPNAIIETLRKFAVNENYDFIFIELASLLDPLHHRLAGLCDQLIEVVDDQRYQDYQLGRNWVSQDLPDHLIVRNKCGSPQEGFIYLTGHCPNTLKEKHVFHHQVKRTLSKLGQPYV